MPRFRNEPTPLHPQTGITVEVTVEIHEEEEEPLTSLYTSHRPMTPLGPMSLIHRLRAVRRLQVEDTDQFFSVQEPSTNDFTEVALYIVAEDEMHEIHNNFTLPSPSVDYATLTTHDVANLIRMDMIDFLGFGQPLIVAESSEGRTEPLTVGNMETGVQADVWMTSVAPLRHIDPSLFHILRGSLHPHTPLRILARWDAFRERLGDSGQTLASLVRQAEHCARRQWPSTVLELYFLLLEYVSTG
jgi:hypothetical protein